MSHLLVTRTATAFLLSGFLLSTGCIKMEHDLRILEDGTATYRLKYSISEQAITQLRAMEKLKADLAKANGEPPPGIEMDPLFHLFLDPDEGALRAAIKQYENDGIKLISLEIESRSAWRNVDIRIKVDDLEKVSKTDFFKTHGFNLTQDAESRYVLSRDPHINIPGQVAKVPSDNDLKQIIPLVAGFNVTVKITTPGRILSTTAFRTTLHTATWTFDFDKESSAIQAVQRQHFWIVFESKKTPLPEMHYRGSKFTK